MATGRPPQLSASAVAMTVKKYFNFSEVYEQTCRVLPSWSDRNLYFQGKSTEASEYVLKIINPEITSYKTIEGTLEIMRHLFSRHLLVPCAISSQTGRSFLLLSSAELFSQEQGDKDVRYPVYLLPYIPGKLFDSLEKKHLTPALLYEVGELVGKIDKELMDFRFPSFVSAVSDDWNIALFPKMKQYLADIPHPVNRRNAERIMGEFEEHVTPVLASLRTGMIHGDINGQNIILTERPSTDNGYHVTGFIDFNDAIETCIIFELGVGLAHIMSANLQSATCSSPVKFVSPIIKGYQAVLPLCTEELGCLYHIVLARCVHVAIHSARSCAMEPWNTYSLTYTENCWKLINYLLSISKQDVDKAWFHH